MRAKPQTSVSPYSALNSWKRLPSTSRAMISRTSTCSRNVSGIRPYRSAGSTAGDSGEPTSHGGTGFDGPRLRTIDRAIASACSSLVA